MIEFIYTQRLLIEKLLHRVSQFCFLQNGVNLCIKKLIRQSQQNKNRVESHEIRGSFQKKVL